MLLHRHNSPKIHKLHRFLKCSLWVLFILHFFHRHGMAFPGECWIITLGFSGKGLKPRDNWTTEVICFRICFCVTASIQSQVQIGVCGRKGELMSLNIIHALYQDTDLSFIILHKKKMLLKSLILRLFTLGLSYSCVVLLPTMNPECNHTNIWFRSHSICEIMSHLLRFCLTEVSTVL